MEMKVLRCPGCGAELEIENDIDIFYCKYCGNKIMVEQSDAAVKAKTRAKMVNDISDKAAVYIRERREYKERKKREDIKRAMMSIVMLFGVFIFAVIFYYISRRLGL